MNPNIGKNRKNEGLYITPGTIGKNLFSVGGFYLTAKLIL
jgi:hypothetical protein